MFSEGIERYPWNESGMIWIIRVDTQPKLDEYEVFVTLWKTYEGRMYTFNFNIGINPLSASVALI